MRRTSGITVAAVLVLGGIVLSCSKKSTPPTAPPPDPACSVSTSILSFGTVTVGSSADRIFTLTNSGGGTLSGAIQEACAQFSLVGSSTFNLGAGQSSSFTVRFAPTAAGAVACSLTAGQAGCVVRCTGEGSAAVGSCVVTPSALSFGTVPVGQVLDRTFTIRNDGAAQLTGSIAETCQGFSLPGTTTYDLAPGDSTLVIVRFSPTLDQVYSCSITTGTSCGPVACTGTGEAGCGVTPTAIDFGRLLFDDSATRTVAITNTGSANIVGTATVQGFRFSLVGTGAYSLGPGQSASLTVRFAPQRTDGYPERTYAGTVTTGGTCPDVILTGIGTFGCDCLVSPLLLDFGNVTVGTSSASQKLRISNSTLVAPLTGQITIVGGQFVAPATYSCRSYGPGAYGTCKDSVDVYFAPTTLGPQTAKIIIQRPGCDGPGAPCDTVVCVGTGVLAAPPQCGVSTNTIDMGVVYFGTSKDTTLTIRNTGGGTLSGSVAFLDNAPPFSLVGTTSYSLGPQASQDFTIRFTSIAGTPGHTYGYVGNLFPGAQCSSQGLDVQVTAIAAEEPPPLPICRVSTDTLYFGSVPLGTTRDLTFQITNTGTGVLSGTAGPIPFSCPEYSFVGPVDYSLRAGESATMTVRCAPTTLPTKNCPLVPVNNIGAGCSEVTLIGEVAAAPKCALIGGTFLDFGTVALGTSKDLYIYMENWGEGTLCGSVTEACSDFSVVQDPNWCVTARPARVYRTIRFSPTSAGPQTCTINAGADCPPITAQGTGN